MMLDIKKIYEDDEKLMKHLQDFCHVSDTFRAPAFDAEKRNQYLFQQIVRFAKENKVYFDRILEQTAEEEAKQAETKCEESEQETA